MSEGQSVLHFSFGGQDYEIASDSHGIMGLTAWIEAAPSKRQERLDYRQLVGAVVGMNGHGAIGLN